VFDGPEMIRTVVRTLVVATCLVVVPRAAWTEVMDKEPTLRQLWVSGILFGVVGFLAWRRHVVAGVVAMGAAALFVWGFHFELTDPYVGSAIVREAGQGYVVQAYGSMLFCAVLHLAGIAMLISKRHGERRRGNLKRGAVER
jgi:hypothetical protein